MLRAEIVIQFVVEALESLKVKMLELSVAAELDNREMHSNDEIIKSYLAIQTHGLHIN